MPDRLLPRDAGFACPRHEFLDLAEGGVRQVIDEADQMAMGVRRDPGAVVNGLTTRATQ
jgi:hypothetical protein